MRKIVALLSILVAAAFSAVAVLTYPLWLDIRAFLGFNLPVMAILAGIGIVFGIYAAFLFRSRYRWFHFIILGFFDVVMVVLLVILFKELGTESVIIARGAVTWLPVAAGILLLVVLIWFGPRWNFMQNGYMRATILAVLAIAAILWLSQPFQLKMLVQPVVYQQQDGLVVAWETNLPGTASLAYGPDPAMSQSMVNQADGLRTLSDRIHSVFLPSDAFTGSLYLQAASEGIRSIKLTNVVSAGQVQSTPLQVSLPPSGAGLSVVAFSDIHEQTRIYNQLAEHITWDGVDEAIYLGDLVSYSADPRQVANSTLSLPTGGRNIPRVFVRGNHETRGEAARLLNGWFLPPEGKWYFTFMSGNVFFVALDSGEDKTDTDLSYAGLNDFADYHRQQAAWLSTVFASQDYQKAAYRVVLVHIPPFIAADQDRFGTVSPEFAPVMDLLNSRTDIDLMMSGHIHEGAIWMPDETGLPYPVTTCGGQYANDAAAVTVRFDPEAFDLMVLDIKGSVIEQTVVPKK